MPVQILCPFGFLKIYFVFNYVCVSEYYMHVSASAPGVQRHGCPWSWNFGSYVSWTWALESNLSSPNSRTCSSPSAISLASFCPLKK